MQEEAKLPATRTRKRKKASDRDEVVGSTTRATRRDGHTRRVGLEPVQGKEVFHQESSRTMSRRDRKQHHSSSESSNISADVADDDDNEETERPWDDSMHRNFVEALFEIGLDQASPSVLMEHMNFSGDKKLAFSVTGVVSTDVVNSERVKSHLQKFRKNKAKSLSDFFVEYDRWMEFAAATVVEDNGSSAGLTTREAGRPVNVRPAAGLHRDLFHEICKKMIRDNTTVARQNLLRGGDLAAFLSFATMREDRLQIEQQQMKATDVKVLENGVQATQRHGATTSTENTHLSLFPGQSDCHPSAKDYSQLLSTGTRFAMPRLSSEEEDSMLGKSFHQVASLFQNVSRLIMAERITPQAYFHEESAILSSVTDLQRSVKPIWVPPQMSRGLDND